MYSQIFSATINTLKESSQLRVSRMDNNQEIISRLKFIGKIKKGEKINTRYMYVQPDGLFTSLKRTFITQDNRSNTLSFIQETIARSFELLITYERSTSDADKTLSKHLVKDLVEAIKGLINLKTTYISDTKFCCDMDAALELINARLNRYRFILDDEEEEEEEKQLN